MIVFDLLKRKNGRLCEKRTVMIPSEQMPHTTFSPEHVVLSIRSMINGNQVFSRKNSDAPK